MFPLRDENPTLRFPITVVVIIGMNAFVWLVVQGMGSTEILAESLCLYALIPGDLLGSVAAGTRFALGPDLVCQLSGDGNASRLFSSMFMHGGWFHLLGNMWFLWVFGDNIEDVMGPLRFACFYVLCGLAAAFAQIATNPGSIVPMVGASGAIGGIMGAYALLYPRAKVHTLIFLGFYITTIAVPAVFMLGYWFLIQVISGVPALSGSGGGVAFWAHIGGFLAGLALIHPFKRNDYMVDRQVRSSARKSNWF